MDELDEMIVKALGSIGLEQWFTHDEVELQLELLLNQAMFYTLLITYILGGLTFIPLLIVVAIYIAVSAEIPINKPDLKPTYTKLAKPPTVDTKAPTLKAWLTVRRTFEASPSTYIAFVRGLLDARSSNPRKAEDSYFTALKGNVLYLYEDEAMSECTAAIDVSRCSVRIYPEGDLLDGELFAKRNAILVTENVEVGEPTNNSTNNNDDDDSEASLSPPPPPWYIFFRSVTVMEDWYLSLVAAQNATPPPYPYEAHAALISSLDALPDLIPTRWLNAIIGRLFLAVKETTAVEAWVIGRIMKKLTKVKTPGFLTSVVIRSFESGDVAPVLSKPMLKELTPEGETSIGVDISYVAPPGGEMRLTLSAVATIALPSTPSLSILGFSAKTKEREAVDKPYQVSLVLAVVVRKVTGNILLKIKRPPSNRLWYAFTTMPHMEITVEPVVSDRQIRWGMVLSVIESKLREVIQESVVLPYMDDIPFFDTSSYDLRGGIFADAFTRPASSTNATATSTTSTAAPVPNAIPITVVDTGIEPGKESSNAKQVAEVLVDAEGDGVLLNRMESFNGGNTRKRRTWFGRKDDDGETDISGSASGSDHRRGKSDDMTSSSGISVHVADGEEGGSSFEVSPETPVLPTPGPSVRRSQSQNSRVVSDGPQTSSPQPPPSAAENSSGLSRSLPSSSPLSSTTPPTSPNPTGSFLAALKSRSAVMAEKQPALKEAMRKWGVGVNWAQGLRKTDKEKEKDGKEPGPSRERDDWEMEGDQGELWGPAAAGKDSSSRESYADLRMKVGLREKARGRQEGSDSNDAQACSRPIDIPGSGSKTKTSTSATSAQEHDDMSKSPSSLRSQTSTSSQRKVSPPSGAPFLTPSAPRTTTEVHTATRPSSPSPLPSGPESGSVSSPLPGDRERPKRQSVSPHPPRQPHAHASQAVVSPPPTPTPLVPIRAQPRAATMTIPGIHASHRGEVMALGSEPERPNMQQQPQQPAIQAKAIQNVYKLFRGGGEGVREQDEGLGKSGASSSSALALPMSPPPLPPRPQSQVEVPTTTTTSSEGGETSSRNSKEFVPPPPILSPASQALKHVAEQDAARKPPPLPVRRPTGNPHTPPSPTSSSASAEPPKPFASSLARSQSASPVMSESLSQSPTQVTEDTDSVKTPVTTNGSGDKWRPPLPPRKGTGASVNHDVQPSAGGEVHELPVGV
ncbi:hypothetical protein BU17DRAFT_87672 [Hysterangium stoloniferum]|nr:hypothetical protein BU17DRAFT_87672 [Hysterangium stoloniferum]